MADKQKNSTTQKDTVVLGFNEYLVKTIDLTLNTVLQSATAEAIKNSKDPGCSPKKEFYDIIYLPNNRTFWLINEDTANALGEAENKFTQAIKLATPEKRLEALSERQITQLFVTPQLLSFLSDQEQLEYEQKQQRKKEIYDTEIAPKIAQDYAATNYSTAQILTGNKEMNQLEKDVEALKRKAISTAEASGYKLVGSQIYNATQIKVKELLEQYAQSQEDVIKLNSQGQYKSIFEAITYYQEAYSSIQDNLLQCNDDECAASYGLDFYRASRELTKRKDALSKHLTTITELANCGIAVSEFAFCPANAEKGLADYLSYLSLFEERQAELDKLNNEFESWSKALGRNATLVPTFVFQNYINKIYTLDQDIKTRREQAEKNIDNLNIPMLCIWDASQFNPKPVDFLYKAVMPLQEYSTPASENIISKLSHLAIGDLSKAVQEQLVDSIKKVPIANLNEKRTESEIFENYLKTQGNVAIKVDEKWFYKDQKIDNDNIKVFDYQAFFKHLEKQNYQIKTLKDEQTKNEWGESLRNILFAQSITKNIMLFDTSFGAAMMRAFCDDGQMVNSKVSGKTLSLKRGKNEQELKEEAEKEKNSPIQKTTVVDKSKGDVPQEKNKLATASIASGEIKLIISPAKGEVTLFDFMFPQPNDDLRHLKITYHDEEGKQCTIDFGSFYMRLFAKAWGFAGASLLMSGQVSIGVNKSQLSLQSLYQATSKDASAKFDVFLGVQAGINLMGELRWVPPLELKRGTEILNLYPYQEDYRVLANLEVSAAAAAGAGISGKIGFGLHRGKFYFVCKVSLIWGVGTSDSVAFEIDYQSLADVFRLLCKLLREVKYVHLSFISPEAFKYLSAMYTLFLLIGAPVFLVTLSLSKLMEVYDAIMGAGNEAMIASRILDKELGEELQRWLKTVPPEALGPFLLALTSFQRGKNWLYFDKNIRANQQRALVRVLGWLVANEDQPFSATKPNATQLLFEKAVSRMNVYGKKEDDPKSTYCLKKAWLDTFMGWSSALREEDQEMVLLEYNEYIEKLGSHINQYCELIDEKSWLQMVNTMGMSDTIKVWRYTGPHYEK